MDLEVSSDDDLGVYQSGVLLAALLFSFVSTDSFAINFIAGRLDHTCIKTPYLDFPLDVYESLDVTTSYPSIGNDFIRNGSYYRFECSIDFRSQMDRRLESLPCIKWKYDSSIFVSTIVSEFDLVCRGGWLVDLVSTFYMTGRLFACLTHGYFSDKFGRKKVLILSHVLKLGGGVMSLYSTNYSTFAVSRFIIAVGSTASCMASFVLLVECSGNKWRSRFCILFNCAPAVGGLLLPVVAYMVRDFRHLQLIYTWPQVVLCLSYFILDESPKWLISQGHREEAFKVKEKIAIVNKTSRMFENPPARQTSKEKMNFVKSDKKKQPFLKQIFSNGMFESKTIASKTLILWMCWFVASIIYYAISLNTGRLPGSIFLNTFFLTIVEIPASLVTIIMMEKFGGRITLGCATSLAAVSLFSMIPFMFYEDCEYVVTGFGILGKGLITVSYNTLYVETAETYPTRIRSQAMGMSASFGRLSSMASSFLGGIMADVWRPLPSLIFGSLALISGGLFVFFPTVNTGDLRIVKTTKEIFEEHSLI